MLQLLLCWRYLRTRYIALASVTSVMLGVATMIVVNAVMAGFSHEMQDRIHGILSDLVLDVISLEGAPDPEAHMQKIQRVAGEYIEGMSPTAHVPAMLSYYVGEQHVTRQVNVIGIDAATYSNVSDFGKYLQHPENRELLDFQLKDGGYDAVDHQADDPSRIKPRTELATSGWPHRRQKARWSREPNMTGREPAPPITAPSAMADPFAAADAEAPEGEKKEGRVFDPSTEQFPGVVAGIALCSYRNTDGTDSFHVLPGDDVELTYPMCGRPPKVGNTRFTITDFYESKMNEYDATFVFVELAQLQRLRGMFDPESGKGHFNSIQIQVKPGVDPAKVRDLIQAAFPPQWYVASTWKDKQGALLAAVQMETAVLNVLLFLIIAVAGFGILAIFFMIVVEKTRDIGVLKSLGAGGASVMNIFLGYGLTLGVAGAGVGMIGGLLFVRYINEIADVLGRLTGRPVFDPAIYYFSEIPTIIEPFTVAWIALGAMGIAVLASVIPARRAARMHPVQALRWE
ncbi:Lipoprotein-releasing system transmembrane protein LolC [Pirellulimonas nuda]|uniref:Lipoprotein-releasing system transmembrane protein LolC n=1 Tax=Pirellulimonas nuda TaxID=2528009 RepID=A0A518DFJ8_9BACT|nr:FtsX-like permease family protein [Pirellulimonas nuda]QDU90212.1 Lipoprotein-releasing system transmembrane protein LolC [Pirellulimonas nuda]